MALLQHGLISANPQPRNPCCACAGVSKNSAKFTFRSGFTVKDKDVSIKYVHAVNAGACVGGWVAGWGWVAAG